MNIIVLFDAVFTIASGVALLLIIWRPQASFPSRGNRALLACLLFCTLMYGFCVFMEWSNISSKLDRLEDVIGALLPMWWAFVLYGFIQQLHHQDIKKSEQKLRAIFNQTFQLTALLDLQGKLLEINDTALEAAGITEPAVKGKPLWQMKWWNHSIELQEKLKDSIERAARGELVRYEVSHPAADGSLSYVDLSLKPVVDDTGKIIMLISEGRDITERKYAEEEKDKIKAQLNQAYKMEAMGTLAGGIAHDFNNILSVIIGYAELAKNEARPGSKVFEALDSILDAGNRAKNLVKQILAFSRQTNVELLPIQLQSLVKEALKLLRSSLPTTIEIQENIESRCGVVLADPTQVHQVILNLCTNANDAMEETGGILKIELKKTHIDQSNRKLAMLIKPGEYVELVVSDTGVGIPSGVIERIFDPFYTTKKVGKGTGMGLAITHGIIVDYGGAITVESKPTKGTSFHVYFPVIEQQAVSPTKEEEAPRPGKERVLFVDDEELLVEIGQKMLSRLGYKVTARSNSYDALATFRENPDEYDIIITDQTMPNMTGSALAKCILQIRPDIPIILCTGYSATIDKKSAHSIGIRGFAMKPLTMNSISKLLREVLDKK